MSRSRLELHEELKAILGSDHVYFSPPESVKLVFPCFIYEMDPYKTEHADNRIYFLYKKYSLTYITKDPDAGEFKDKDKFEEENANNMLERILEHFGSLCAFDRSFSSDNLMHFNFTLYY